MYEYKTNENRFEMITIIVLQFSTKIDVLLFYVTIEM